MGRAEAGNIFGSVGNHSETLADCPWDWMNFSSYRQPVEADSQPVGDSGKSPAGVWIRPPCRIVSQMAGMCSDITHAQEQGEPPESLNIWLSVLLSGDNSLSIVQPGERHCCSPVVGCMRYFCGAIVNTSAYSTSNELK